MKVLTSYMNSEYSESLKEFENPKKYPAASVNGYAQKINAFSKVVVESWL